MFILTPIAINSSLTSKRAHVSSDSDSGVSSKFLRFLKVSPHIALIGFPNVRENEKGLKPLSSCDSIISLHEYYLINPIGEGVRN